MKIVGVHLEPGPVGWHRCWNWTTALAKRGHKVTHRPFEADQFDWGTIDDHFRGADVVIAGRMHHARVFAALLAGRKLYKYKLVVDTDDNADALEPMNQAFADYHSGAGTTRLVRAEYREADLVTVTTPHLAEHARKYASRVVVMPNVVDTALYANVRSRQREERHKDIRIYWGGGGGHYADLLSVKEPLLQVFNENPSVKLVFSNFVPDWAASLPPYRVFMIQFARLAAYPKVLKWLCPDIALAPLVENEFNRCKSHVKYLDYGMADVAGVYQDLEPYAGIKHGVTGLKARTQNDWYKAVTELINMPEKRVAIAKAAKADILANWTIDQHVGRYEAMLQELVATKPVPEVKALVEGASVEAPCLAL